MTNTFCTIITADYYPFALALYKSLKKFDPGVSLQVLVADDKPVTQPGSETTGINIIPIGNLQNYSLTNSLFRKYAHINMDFFRWSLKPIFISYLLEKGFKKVLFTDCDQFFFNDYQFLFNELDSSAVLLTPHWYNSNPLTDKNNFIALLTRGIFNAGFIGTNENGLPALRWWAEACHFEMGTVIEMGILDDQRYLDALPVKFDNVKIIRHKGCNLTVGSHEECKRELVGNNVLINGKDPIIFIHFTNSMAIQILKGHDPLLLPYLKEFQRTFEENNYKLSDYLKALKTHGNSGIMKKLMWKLRIRTRLKQFIYKLAESI